MSTPLSVTRVFLACATQDLKFAELLTARAHADRLPVVFERPAEGKTDEAGWQLECRRRLRGSRAVVVLLSPHTSGSVRVRWQMEEAKRMGMPMLGITVSYAEDAAAGAAGRMIDLKDLVLGWKWKTIAATLMRLVTEAPMGNVAATCTSIDREEGNRPVPRSTAA